MSRYLLYIYDTELTINDDDFNYAMEQDQIQYCSDFMKLVYETMDLDEIYQKMNEYFVPGKVECVAWDNKLNYFFN